MTFSATCERVVAVLWLSKLEKKLEVSFSGGENFWFPAGNLFPVVVQDQMWFGPEKPVEICGTTMVVDGRPDLREEPGRRPFLPLCAAPGPDRAFSDEHTHRLWLKARPSCEHLTASVIRRHL